MEINPLSRFARWVRSTYEPGVDDPWWQDNLGHFIGGAAVGGAAHLALGLGLLESAAAFLAVAAVWETFEYRYNVRPWDGREDWGMDRAIEDTVLDTVVGLAGALLVVWLLI